jgi:hypothetical protein
VIVGCGEITGYTKGVPVTLLGHMSFPHFMLGAVSHQVCSNNAPKVIQTMDTVSIDGSTFLNISYLGLVFPISTQKGGNSRNISTSTEQQR